jgi:hypothetical protein
MGLAGVGFSAFNAGLLGNTRGFYGDTSLIGTEAMAQDASVTQWLKDVGSKFKGTTIRYTSEATPPTVVLDKIKQEFIEPTGINVEIEIVPLEQVLAKATLDVQGQLGSYDLYYLDQSWVATFAQDTFDPRVLQGQAGPGDAGLRLRRLLEGPRRGSCRVRRQVGRHSLRHPDLHHHVPPGPVGQAQASRAQDGGGLHQRRQGSSRPKRATASTAPASRPSRVTIR